MSASNRLHSADDNSEKAMIESGVGVQVNSPTSICSLKRTSDDINSQASAKKHHQDSENHSNESGTPVKYPNVLPLQVDYAKKGSVENESLTMKTTIDNVLWRLKFLKYTPLRTNEDTVNMIEYVCNSVDSIVNLSDFNMSDIEYRRTLKILEALFSLIQSFEDDSSFLLMTQIYIRVEVLFDNILDCLSQANLNAEEQLIRFGYIKGILPYIADKNVRKPLVEKLILRIRSTTKILLRGCTHYFNENSENESSESMQMVDSADINLYLFYCELLEATITVVTSDSQLLIGEVAYDALSSLEEDSNALFAMLPNLRFVLYPSIIAASLHLKKTD